jgi:hypothetical protein
MGSYVSKTHPSNGPATTKVIVVGDNMPTPSSRNKKLRNMNWRSKKTTSSSSVARNQVAPMPSPADAESAVSTQGTQTDIQINRTTQTEIQFESIQEARAKYQLAQQKRAASKELLAVPELTQAGSPSALSSSSSSPPVIIKYPSPGEAKIFSKTPGLPTRRIMVSTWQAGVCCESGGIPSSCNFVVVQKLIPHDIAQSTQRITLDMFGDVNA